MPRYVILHHHMHQSAERESHWDLMLETGNCLRTWALHQVPQPDQPIAADALTDHRRVYLDYEGPVSGNRGSVTRWDCGTYDPVLAAPQQWEVVVRGERLTGRIRLQDTGTHQRWTFTFTGVIAAT